MPIGKYYQLGMELSYIYRDTHVSSIRSRSISVWWREKRRRRRRRIAREKNSNKQSTAAGYIHIISSNTPADSGNEANKKSFIVRISDISNFFPNDNYLATSRMFFFLNKFSIQIHLKWISSKIFHLSYVYIYNYRNKHWFKSIFSQANILTWKYLFSFSIDVIDIKSK